MVAIEIVYSEKENHECFFHTGNSAVSDFGRICHRFAATMYHGFHCLLTLALDNGKTAVSASELTENLQLPLQHAVELQMIGYRPVPLVFGGLARARMCSERYRITTCSTSYSVAGGNAAMET